jgi:organic hydroperoxide reductase OsmC/OhrA
MAVFLGMSKHIATIRWEKPSDEFLRGKYSRVHTWSFDGGASLPASPSPGVVPAPWSDPALIDPEEAFVASVASCHMLTFLFVASRMGFSVASYEDEAVGEMTKNEKGIPWISRITLHPKIAYAGDKQPGAEDIAKMHHLAHEQCFIANSVKTEVVVE